MPYTPDGEIDYEAKKNQEYDFALYLIDGLLEHESTPGNPQNLAVHQLPQPVIVFDEHHVHANRMLREELAYQIPLQEVDEALTRLNHDQRFAADTILDAVDNPDEFGGEQLFFLNGAGGTGKTMVQNTVMKKLRSQQKIALAVASSGIAATLLVGGRTAHSRFKIPLDTDNQSQCGIEKGTNLAELIKRAAVIFWDEAPMQNRYDMEAVSRSLQDICGNEAYFGGKVVCFCGDFRQITPVVVGGSDADVITHSMCRAEFFHEIQVLDLTINERLNNPHLTDVARRETAEFAAELIRIGDGDTTVHSAALQKDVASWPHSRMAMNTQEALMDKIYPDLPTSQLTNDYLSDRAILAITNQDVAAINDRIISRMGGDSTIYRSEDRAVDDEQNETWGPEQFNQYYEAGLPPHILRLKVGAVVMMLRNLDAPRLCNGTRLRIMKLGAKVIEAQIISGSYANQTVLLFKCKLQCKDNNKHIPVPFTRTQFPIRLAFAMTINKSQGQSMKYIGVDLRQKDCFSHGQLYVALSRVTMKSNLYIITRDDDIFIKDCMLINKVLKNVLLNHNMRSGIG